MSLSVIGARDTNGATLVVIETGRAWLAFADSLLEYYRTLIALRRSHPELHQDDESVIPTNEANAPVVDRRAPLGVALGISVLTLLHKTLRSRTVVVSSPRDG